MANLLKTAHTAAKLINDYRAVTDGTATEVIIPGNTSKISARFFAYCTNLQSVTIPNGVVSIEEAAFAGCTNLAEMTLPKSVTSIGNSIFSNCSSLTTVTLFQT